MFTTSLEDVALNPHTASCSLPKSGMGSAPAELEEALVHVASVVPPLWPLRDYVAVNPFMGWSSERFLTACGTLCAVRQCDLLMPRVYFQSLLEEGAIRREDVERACAQCLQEYPHLYADIDATGILEWLKAEESLSGAEERWFLTVAEWLDRAQSSDWTTLIVEDISRHCAAHFDEGQAFWPSPFRDMPLYAAWRAAARIGSRMDALGVSGFRALVAGLPANPADAIDQMLKTLGVPRTYWREFLLCQIHSIAGWASYVQYRGRQAAQDGPCDDDLTGLLAIRLAYDVALAQAAPLPGECRLWPAEHSETEAMSDRSETVSRSVLARYALQTAREVAYRREACAALLGRDKGSLPSERKTAQMIFCIDVRSEVVRRHLEAVSDEIETFGFAGFFAMPLEYVPLGENRGSAHCPVLIQPDFRVDEGLRGRSGEEQGKAVRRRRVRRSAAKLWKSFQSSAVSCYSFVESLGFLYVGKLLADSWRWIRPFTSARPCDASRTDQARVGPIASGSRHALPLERKVALAEGMLRNLGLTEDFAPLVVVCGHASQVINNLYKAGLDCGACGGHSGEPNARFAATLLNDTQVRQGLAERGIRIPDTTWFVAAVHDTTTDEIQFRDTDELPHDQAASFGNLQTWVREASGRTRDERCRRLGNPPVHDVWRRSRDWSEVRPEWGLAGNAAFIVAPRTRTAGLDLQGRVFLHNYDQRKDPNLTVLELIMTAPMIVTSWINLQYYASAVDNRAFGSGNKLIHNVVGQLGILEGNGGDLMTGLPWQSLHDGVRLQHEPLRLLVVIEASRQAVRNILDKHSSVRDLVSNGWVTLVVLEQDQCFRWTHAGTWELECDSEDKVARGAAQGIALQER